ncbi:MAG: ScyD/ScyE family protein [Candidatus Limnocylindria bacterium]
MRLPSSVRSTGAAHVAPQPAQAEHAIGQRSSVGDATVQRPRSTGLPDVMPAQPVPTSIAVGPDGAFYVGELKGFPGPVGESRVWRIDPGACHADCATGSACTVVADGFTSIVDLNFGPDGTLYVTELDEASWASIEIAGAITGGTINACDVTAGSCSVVAGGLPMAMSATVGGDGALCAAILGLVPGSAEVIRLGP